jgi:hypothetical protein
VRAAHENFSALLLVGCLEQSGAAKAIALVYPLDRVIPRMSQNDAKHQRIIAKWCDGEAKVRYECNGYRLVAQVQDVHSLHTLLCLLGQAGAEETKVQELASRLAISQIFR